MDDPTNTFLNNFHAFLEANKTIVDINVVSHGQEPPTQKFSRCRRRTKTRSSEAIDAEWDAYPESALFGRGTYSSDAF
jgi:hypothetical protein